MYYDPTLYNVQIGLAALGITRHLYRENLLKILCGTQVITCTQRYLIYYFYINCAEIHM